MPKKILIVDDEPNVVKIVEAELKASGYQVYTALNGKDGLAKCRLHKPDAIILDIMMPGIDGAMFAEEVKSDPDIKNIPIIFLTALVQKEEVFNSHEIAGQYFLAKPFDGVELRALLKKVIDLKPAV